MKHGWLGLKSIQKLLVHGKKNFQKKFKEKLVLVARQNSIDSRRGPSSKREFSLLLVLAIISSSSSSSSAKKKTNKKSIIDGGPTLTSKYQTVVLILFKYFRTKHASTAIKPTGLEFLCVFKLKNIKARKLEHSSQSAPFSSTIQEFILLCKIILITYQTSGSSLGVYLPPWSSLHKSDLGKLKSK